MSKLHFLARGIGLVTRPDYTPIVDQSPRYVGRRYDPKTRTLPATREGFYCDANSPEGRRLVKLTRRDQSLWPADEQTAAACGVQYVPVVFEGGEWIPAGDAKAKPPPPKLES